MRTSRARGVPRSRAGTCATRSSSRRSPASTSTSAGSRLRPPGFEVVVSTAHAGRVAGRSRAEFLAELVSLRRAIVVGGAHGKTTTAAMVAYVLRELGHDPSWIIGGVVPQLGGNAGVGEGWLVVEGDESDRSIALLRPEIAVVTNVELDHHADVRVRGRARGLLRGVARRSAGAVRGWELEPVDLELGVPGRAQPRERRHRAGGARARGCRACRRRGGDRLVHGCRPPVRARRRARRRARHRRLRPQPHRDRGGAADGARRSSRARSSPSTSRTSTSGRASSTASSAPRSASPTRRS